jgi:hypothetical protein
MERSYDTSKVQIKPPYNKVRVPDAVQRALSGAPQMRDLHFHCSNMDPASAAPDAASAAQHPGNGQVARPETGLLRREDNRSYSADELFGATPMRFG